MLGGITSSELFKQSKIWIKTAAHSAKNLAKTIIAKFSGKKLSEEELKNLHKSSSQDKIPSLDRSKLSEDEIKMLDLKLGEMNTLCKKVLPRSGDVGLFFTSPENPQDPLANLMDKTVFNLVRTISASKNEEELLDSLGEELAKVIPVHVGAIVNDNGNYIVIQSDFRGIKNKLRIENLEDLTFRSTKYGSVLSLHSAGYTSNPRTLINNYKKTSDQYNYSLSTLFGRGLNVITNGFVSNALENFEINQENLLAKIKDSQVSENIQRQMRLIKDKLIKFKSDSKPHTKSSKGQIHNKNDKAKMNLDTICVDFITNDLLNKIVPITALRKLVHDAKETKLKSQMTPNSIEKTYLKGSNNTRNYVKFTNEALALTTS